MTFTIWIARRNRSSATSTISPRERTRRRGLKRKAEEKLPKLEGGPAGEITSNHTAEEYMAGVERVREGMKRGDYYEVVLRQTFSAPFKQSLSSS